MVFGDTRGPWGATREAAEEILPRFADAGGNFSDTASDDAAGASEEMVGELTDFLDSWVLTLSAHSNVLQAFDGGDANVGIHGRGGSSLLDPLGSARSHGCIRLANNSIDWLVHTIGRNQVPGTPIQIN
jgi:hypothetical protein